MTDIAATIKSIALLALIAWIEWLIYKGETR